MGVVLYLDTSSIFSQSYHKSSTNEHLFLSIASELRDVTDDVAVLFGNLWYRQPYGTLVGGLEECCGVMMGLEV